VSQVGRGSGGVWTEVTPLLVYLLSKQLPTLPMLVVGLVRKWRGDRDVVTHLLMCGRSQVGYVEQGVKMQILGGEDKTV
jgi:hypothetical protein